MVEEDMEIALHSEVRMTSSGLPGKVLLPALNKLILSYLIESVRCVSIIDVFVLAATTNSGNVYQHVNDGSGFLSSGHDCLTVESQLLLFMNQINLCKERV